MKFPKIEVAWLALIISIITVSLAALQYQMANQERTAPLQTQLHQAQVANIITMLESLHNVCYNRMCKYPEWAGRRECANNAQEAALAKASSTAVSLSIVSSSAMSDVGQRMLDRLKTRANDNIDALAEQIRKRGPRFADEFLAKQCSTDITAFASEFQQVLGINLLSSRLLAKAGAKQ